MQVVVSPRELPVPARPQDLVRVVSNGLKKPQIERFRVFW